MRSSPRGLSVVWLVLLVACADPPAPPFEIVVEQTPAALLAISGTSEHDVWAVGADRNGFGPLVTHYDGARWERVATGTTGDLWWVHALPDQTVFLAGAGSTILRRRPGEAAFARMPTPGVARHIVFGLWAAASDDAWAVGSLTGARGGFIWRLDASGWRELPLPTSLRGTDPGLFKVWGDGQGRVWVVGNRGVVLRYAAGSEEPELLSLGSSTTLFTVHGAGDQVVIVGLDTLVEGRAVDGALSPTNHSEGVLLQGVYVAADGQAVATGAGGVIYMRAKGGGWSRIDHDLALDVESLHAAWIDPQGGVWAVGGNVLSNRLDHGVIVHRGAPPASAGLDALNEQPRDPGPATCPEAAIDPRPDGSIARRWNEQVLGAIRRAIPQPGVHARNLFHLSAAMWDAWAAYDATPTGLFVTEKAAAADVEAPRAEAISYAAYRLLVHRYDREVGGPTSLACFRAFMTRLGYDPDDTAATAATPRALGNRIGAALIEAGRADGANEASDYADPDGYESPNASLVVDDLGTVLAEPSTWQPLNLSVAVTQNGIPTAGGRQDYIGAHWGQVAPFAMQRPAPGALYHDPGPAPRFTDPEMVEQVVEVIRRTSQVDASLPTLIDLSPGAYGNNSLGHNDGQGHPLNPFTAQPYPPQLVRIGDFGRALAEFWADGPHSETPPGHWNVIANEVADTPGFVHRLFGQGAPVARLEWDVKLYIAMNGAVHDAAIAAWELKRAHVSVRPISVIRHMATLGQRSDPSLPAYHPDGLPLVPGLIEVITEASSAPGQRHAALALYVGEIAIEAWRGEPGDRAREATGCAWIRGGDWMPYQRRTFVTPAFPGFVSGHSTFSRASAEVLTAFTGTSYFPGGLGEHVAVRNTSLTFEMGPSTDVRLQWATYHDAADQAGQSRIWGGIHPSADDLAGRTIGAQIGLGAVERARTLY